MRLLRSLSRFSTRLPRPTSSIPNRRPIRSFMSTAPEAKASTSATPKWFPPTKETDGPVLKFYNSLTGKTPIPFVPIHGKDVSFYNCGPTVYSNSHLGHARNYTAQDFVRRALRDYFGYNVHFVMNITDIDDKIIIKSSEEYLLKETKSKNSVLTPELLETVKTAFADYLDSKLVKCLPHPVAAPSSATPLQRFAAILDRYDNEAGLAEGKANDEKFEMHINSLKSARDAITAAEASGSGDGAAGLIDASADVLGPYLRSKLGHTISNPREVAGAYAQYWEGDFFNDMDRLHILRPDRLTRVSEFVPEIVSFVEKIQDRGFAYEAQGSVYFDVAKFDGAEGDGFRHEYAKLAPTKKGNKALLDEGEGSLTGSLGKRQPADFALWKAKSKPGEPAWQSRRWGEGRPGWHIECSVMASEVLGAGMDIHSGGEDLKFPHHDNELAQSEAYHGCKQWVNYFLHSGHLHIHGSKMSKSLKNFTTINDALNIFTPRQLRLAFMCVPWHGPMNYEEKKTLAEATKIEADFDKFFDNVQALTNDRAAQPLAFDGAHHYEQPERDLAEATRQAQAKFHERMCDSIDTPGALRTLQGLVSTVNTYRASRGANEINLDAIRVAAEWITRMLLIFGLGEGSVAASGGQIGWGKLNKTASNGGGGDMDDKLVRAFAAFRDEVREYGVKNGSKDLLELCDRLRDHQMVELGIQLEDGMGAGGRALVKREDPAVLIKQREEKAAIAADKAAKKAANAAAAQQQKQAQLEKGRTSPSEMFKPPHSELYSDWDDNGLPTKDKEGTEVSKAGGKKLLKEWKAQEKLHEAFLASQKDGQ